MKKINQISAIRNDFGSKSDLFTRFKKQMEPLLSTNDVRPGSDKDKEFYLPDTETEQEFSLVLEDKIDTFSILIGYAGIGKSTVLRNYFQYKKSLPTVRENDSILIFPASFNGLILNDVGNCPSQNSEQGMILDVKEDLANRIDSVCSFLEDRYEGLKKKFDSVEGQLEFYNYLNETNPKALSHVPYDLRIGLSNEEEKMLKLSYAYKYERFICATTKLKYYLSNSLCPCNKIIVILDDIEPLPYIYQVQLVMQYVRFYDCMKNAADRDEDKKYVVNLLISMRPHTYRVLKEYRAFKSFYVTREILKKDMVDLYEYFQKKVKYYSKNIDVYNQSAWDQSWKILNILSSKFNRKYANMIKNICLMNTRDAVKAYTTVLINRIWVQRNMDKTAEFTINEDDYVFNNITVIRALACEQYYVYAKRGSYLIPNILCNTVNNNYSFINLCILRCFEKDKNQDYIYGTKSKSLKEISDYFIYAFPGYNEIAETVRTMVSYLFEQKILCKSINDTDTEETIDKPEALGMDNLLYLSPKGYELWHMMESDSVYMELCREDYYRDYSENNNLNNESSFELMQKGQQILIFYDLFLFLLELLDEEDKYISYAVNQNTIDIYTNYFGDNVLCEQLYKGIWKSIEYSGNSENQMILSIKEKTLEKIESIERKLR